MAVVDIWSRDVVPVVPLVAGFIGWTLFRLLVERVVQWYKPSLYNELRADYQGKYMIFFGLLLGLFAKPMTLVSCGLAAWKTPAEVDIAGIHPPMNGYQEQCWNSRIVVYVSELPHYIHVPELVLHHLMILMAMGVIARWRAPHRGLDLSLAALWTEIPNSLRAILRRTHYLRDHPRLDWHLAVWSTIGGFLIRAPGVMLAMAMIPQSGMQGGPAWIMGSAYFFYLVYIFDLTYRRLRNSDVLQIDDSGAFRLRFDDRFNINSTSLMTGLAVLGTQVSTLAVYTLAKGDGHSMHTWELVNVSWNLVMVAIVSLIGSQLLAPRIQKLLQWCRQSSVYLQAGIVIAVIFLTFTPTLQQSVDRQALVASMLLSSSFSKAVSQMASHLASAADGVYSQDSVICSIFNFAQFGAAIVSVAAGRPILDLAFKSLLLQLVIRLTVDSREFDHRKPIVRLASLLLPLTLLAAMQVIWPLRNSVKNLPSNFGTNSNDTAEANSKRFMAAVSAHSPNARTIMRSAAKEFNMLVFMAAYYHTLSGYAHCRRLVRSTRKATDGPAFCTSRNMGLVSLVIWACYIARVVMTAQTPENHNKDRNPLQIIAEEPPFCTLVLSWQFWASISASFLVSTVAAHVWQPRSLSQAKKIRSDSFWDQE